MSGLNKQKKIFKKQTIIVLIVYLLLSITVIEVINNLGIVNNFLMKKKVTKIKDEVESSLIDGVINKPSLNEVVKEMPMQLIIRQQDNTVYSNTAINDIELLKGSTDEKLIFYDATYEIQKKDTEYQVYLLVYNQTTSDMIELVSVIFILALILISGIIIFFVISAGRLLIKPLDHLGSNLQKLKMYKFDGIMSLEDKVTLFSDELAEFASDIKSKSEDFALAYTGLEKELLMSKEESDYKKQLVSSLVHDLKTPLNIIKLQATTLETQTSVNSKLIKENKALNEINVKADNVLVDVKEILNVVNLDKIESIIEDVDLGKEIKTSISLFSKLFRKRQLHNNIQLIPQAIIKANKVEIQSIINNSLANVHKYAKENSKVDILLDKEEDMFILQITNEADDINKIDFDNAFNLFQVNDENNDGTGVGLFVINQFIQRNNGVCEFFKFEDKVRLKIKLPMSGVDLNE